MIEVIIWCYTLRQTRIMELLLYCTQYQGKAFPVYIEKVTSLLARVYLNDP